jgi:hypothetical protein
MIRPMTCAGCGAIYDQDDSLVASIVTCPACDTRRMVPTATVECAPPPDLLDATREVEAHGCPDGGTCHHGCAPGACFPVKTCAPVSGVYPGDVWPAAERAKMLAWWSDKETAQRRTEDALTRLLHAHRASIDAANRAGDTTAYLEQLSERGGWPKDMRETEARLRERESVSDARHGEFEAMRRAFVESVTVGFAPLPAREAMEAALAKLRDFAEADLYGHFYGGDPRDFRPDPDCNTPEELERHRAACEAWNRGERTEVTPAGPILIDRPGLGAQRGMTSGDFGLGTTHVRDREITAICDRLEAALAGDRTAKPIAEDLCDAEASLTEAKTELETVKRELETAQRRIASLEGRLGVAEEACGASLPELLNVSQEMVGRIALAFSERGSIRAANLAEAVDELIVSERSATHRLGSLRAKWTAAVERIGAARAALKVRPPIVEWAFVRTPAPEGDVRRAVMPFATIEAVTEADGVMCRMWATPVADSARPLAVFKVCGPDAMAEAIELLAKGYWTYWRSASGWYEAVREALDNGAGGAILDVDEDTAAALDRLRRVAWATSRDEPVTVGCIDLCLICETLAAAAGLQDAGDFAGLPPGDGT